MHLNDLTSDYGELSHRKLMSSFIPSKDALLSKLSRDTFP